MIVAHWVLAGISLFLFGMSAGAALTAWLQNHEQVQP